MKPQDLRVGNLILVDNDIVEVDSITKEGVNVFIDDESIITFADFGELDHHIKPIPLTEEWLLKFGFVQDENTGRDYMLMIDDYELYLEGYQTYFVPHWDRMSFKKNIACVHQLQNLFFSLCGEELTLKETVNK
jgi:hypothetical protein